MNLSAESLQLLFIDGLFLGLAVVLALWFRSWIKSQQRGIDQRLAGLEAQHERFDRLGTRLQSACRSIENLSRRMAGEADSGAVAQTAAPEGSGRPLTTRGNSESAASADAAARRSSRASRLGSGSPYSTSGQAGISGAGFARARDMLEQGLPAKEVAERLGMGLAEVDALKRMMDFDPTTRGAGPRK